MTAADVPALFEIERRVLRAGEGQVRTEEECTPETVEARVGRFLSGDRAALGVLLVAEEGGRVVGEAQASRLPPSGCRHVAQLGLHVDPEAQGRGHGRALTTALLAWCREVGVSRVELQVRADNRRAMRLYRSLGFAEEVRRGGFLRLAGEELVDVGMACFLGPPTARKAVALGVRDDRGRRELLCFEHPHAGWQLPKGTVEEGEDPAAAVVRELAEETGLTEVGAVEPVGAWTVHRLPPAPVGVQAWYGFLVPLPAGLPDRWVHVATGSADEEGLPFACRWVPLDEAALEAFPPLFHEPIRRALEHP